VAILNVEDLIMEKIFEVTEVELESSAPQLTIRASGYVSTSGWSNPQLRPVFVQAPPDGIYDFDFVAERPTGTVLDTLTHIDEPQTFRLA
jgi:hypothetical protein